MRHRKYDSGLRETFSQQMPYLLVPTIRICRRIYQRPHATTTQLLPRKNTRMNMLYNTPQEAIAACEAENERSWQEYLKGCPIDATTSPEIIASIQSVFRAGYMAGARFVSGALVEKLMTHGKTHIIEPQS